MEQIYWFNSFLYGKYQTKKEQPHRDCSYKNINYPAVYLYKLADVFLPFHHLQGIRHKL